MSLKYSTKDRRRRGFKDVGLGMSLNSSSPDMHEATAKLNMILSIFIMLEST
jgi:hypothetical protein